MTISVKQQMDDVLAVMSKFQTEPNSKPKEPENEQSECSVVEKRRFIIDFGKVEVFKELTKTFRLNREDSKDQVTYSIKRDPTTKCIKEMFYLNHCDGILNPKENVKLNIIYKPTIPFQNSLEVFEFVDSDFKIYQIVLKGEAIGPICKISSKKLMFYKTPTKKIMNNKVEIVNVSLASAQFKFDQIDTDIFQVSPLEGIIKGNSYEIITISFSPTKRGTFARQLFCLIWNSEPLIIEVLGNYNKSLDSNFNQYNFPFYQTVGFGAYLNDSLAVRLDVPPFSLSSIYLDFGRVLANENMPKTQVTSLTNHMKNEIFVDWVDGSKIFQIVPQQLRVLANSSAQFKCHFSPGENYNVYSETMVAQVYWASDKSATSELCATLPLMCTIKVQGHSFPDNEGWLAHIQVIPEAVVLQSCLPGSTACGTFKLQNRSHLPVMYRLVPPIKTNITVKPMIGKFRNFEVISVHLQTEKLKIKVYIEEWHIVYNGREEKSTPFYIKGETSIPSVEIGRQNKIFGGIIQEDSQKNISVPMKNTSWFSISYKFVLSNPLFLNISPIEGILKSNEETHLMVTCVGNKCAPKPQKFTCAMRFVDGHGAISGDMYEREVEFFCETSYSQLCAFPKKQDFGRVPFGSPIETEFEAFNFGETTIYFQIWQKAETRLYKQFNIKPSIGEVKPQSMLRFRIEGTVRETGEQTIQFVYMSRVEKDSIKVAGPTITLFECRYNCGFPTIQVKEIVEHNFGHLFGKRHLSEYLQISRFNKILQDISNDQIERIDLQLPEFEVQDKIYYIILALKNISIYETDIKLKNKKVCECSLKETANAAFHQRKKGYDCPHRELLQMEMSDTKFYEQTHQFLKISIKYKIPNETEMCYVLNLSNNRQIEIYFKIYGIPKDIPHLSCYTKEFTIELKKVFIGTRVAPIQLFWLYNNTKNLINYKVDTEEIEHLCKIDGFKVLECINPKDQLVPYESKPLLIRFHPIETKIYTVLTELTFQTPGHDEKQSRTLLIKGTGDMGSKPSSVEVEKVLPAVPTYCKDFPVTFSLESIKIGTIPVWNKRKELIFIKNNSKDRIVQYIWQTVRIENLIEVSTETKYGILRPKEVHPVLIKIKSFGEPCIGNVLLTCEVTDYTDIVLHQITKEKYEEVQKTIIQEFKITDHEVTKPKNPVKITPEPEPLITSLILNIISVHTKDLDSVMDPLIQFKQYPNQVIENTPKSILKKYFPREMSRKSFPEKDKVEPRITQNERLIYGGIIQEIISDVLFSDSFKSILEISSEAPFHKYIEFVMDDQQIISEKRVKTPLSNQDIVEYRKQEIKNFFSQPTVTNLSNILQKIIYDSVLKAIRCSPAELNLKEINELIEKNLYNCKNIVCSCNKGT